MEGRHDTYKFSKTLLERMAEIVNVLDNGVKLPASGVHHEWKNFLEVAVEPAGWQTIWRISRPLCETLKLRYPAVVMGTVEQVFYDELTALLIIENVEDDGQEDLELPEQYEVPLIELWPLAKQENSVLNIDLTADAIDQLRFFFTKIWRPWDIDLDDDTDWATKYLETRINFHFELSSKRISPRLTMHIKTLLEEASYLHKHKEILESQMDDEEDLEDAQKSSVKELMNLHLRLKMLQNEIELLENPDMRNNFEHIKFDEQDVNCQSFKRISLGSVNATVNPKCDTFVVLNNNTLTESISYLESINKEVKKDQNVQVRHSLQNVLECNSHIDTIFLSPGIHYLKFSEYLMGNCKITGPTIKDVLHECVNPQEMAILKSKDYDNILLIVDSIKEFTLENIHFDCYNVRVGLVAKSGNITLKNCVFEGDPSSSIREGLVVHGSASVRLENCKIQNFATGIRVYSKSNVTLIGTVIENCIVGIDTQSNASLNVNSTNFKNNQRFGMLFTSENLQQEKLIFNELDMNKLLDMNINELNISEDTTFSNNKKGTLAILRAQGYEEFDDYDAVNTTDIVMMEHESSNNDLDDSSVILLDDSVCAE